VARISDQNLRIGRMFLQEKDLEGLVAWARHLSIPTLDLSLLSQVFQELFEKDDMRRALWQFNHYFNRVDPDLERRKWFRERGFQILQILVFSLSVYWTLFWNLPRGRLGARGGEATPETSPPNACVA
jgi:hypothetical protein